MFFIIILLIVLGIQWYVVIFWLILGEYKTKVEFLLRMIPYYHIVYILKLPVYIFKLCYEVFGYFKSLK